MAEKRTIEIEIKDNSKETAKNFENVAKSTNKIADSVEDLNKSTKGADGGLKKVGSAIKGMGVAFKAAGIGLIISAFVTLKEVFTQNQKVADALASVFETISIVFNEVARVVTDVYQRVSEATGGFDALGKVIQGLVNIALAPLKAAFYGAKLGVQELQLIWEKSFLGSKDQNTIKNLRKEIQGTKKDLEDIGKGVLKSSKDIYNNFAEAAGEVGSLVKETVKGVTDISVKSAYEQAKANVEIQNRAKIAAAQQSLLIEKYDRAAEKLRQVRDEERNTIDERIKANNQLKEVLDLQEKALLRQADLQVQAARNEVAKSNNIENQVALLEAQANRQGVLAQIEGLRSEQLANDLALNREKLELTETQLEAETNLANEQKRFDAERIKDEEQRLTQLIQVVKDEEKIELERLQKKIDSYKVGTQARLDAEIEFNQRKQELENEAQILEDELSNYRIEKAKEESAKRLELANNEALARAELNTIIEGNSLQSQIEFLQVQRDIELQNTELTESEKALIKEKYREAERQAELASVQKSLDTQQSALQSIQNLSDIFFTFKMKNLEKGSKEEEKQARRQFKFNKALQLGLAVIDGAKAITASLAQAPVAIGPVPNPAGIASLALAATTSAINIAKIASQQFESASSGSSASLPTSGGSASGGGATPNFNVVGNSTANQLAQIEQKPVQAFVVSGEVTSAQALDRNRQANATFG